MDAVRAVPGGVRLRLRLTPKGGRDRVDGWSDGGGEPHLKVRVRAAPEDGKANDALIVLLAKSLAVNKSCVRIVAGHGARLKAVEISGDTGVLSARLEKFGIAK